MRSERGQATVEWAGLLLLVALVLVAAGRLVPRAGGERLGSSLASSVADVPRSPPPRIRFRPVAQMAVGRGGQAGRAGRAAGAVWRSAWFGCLVYERFRYARRHPESRLPGYTFPYAVAARIASRCVSPVDLLRGVPALDPGS